MRDLNISLFGMSIFSENKGCMALAYSFLDLLSEALGERKANVYVFSYLRTKSEIDGFKQNWGNLNITFHETSIRRKNIRKEMDVFLSQSDVCFDSTEGDSFSDIYGVRRILVQTLKKYAALKRCQFVLTPQTYGPFNSSFSKMLAKRVFKRSLAVYSRDESSAELIKGLFKIDAKISTDTAFALKPIKVEFEKRTGVNVGINISGLLYNGGYTGDNQFGLSVDYKKYVEELIHCLSKNKEYNIHLIPHVICDDYDYCENDLKVCEMLKEKYPDCYVVKGYGLSGELKYVISQMDVFTGARMHSTIAAFSSGVPTIPFAYSKKFGGLYDSLDYPFVVDGRKLTTGEAVERTIELIEKRNELKKSIACSLEIAAKQLDVFRNGLKEILNGIESHKE